MAHACVINIVILLYVGTFINFRPFNICFVHPVVYKYYELYVQVIFILHIVYLISPLYLLCTHRQRVSEGSSQCVSPLNFNFHNICTQRVIEYAKNASMYCFEQNFWLGSCAAVAKRIRCSFQSVYTVNQVPGYIHMHSYTIIINVKQGSRFTCKVVF